MAAFDRQLTEAEARVKRFEDAKHEVKITTSMDSSAMAEARRAFSQLDQQITRDAVQRAAASPQGSLLGTLSSLMNPKSAGGRFATGLKGVSPLIAGGLAALPAIAATGGVGLAAGAAGGGALAAALPAAGVFAAVAKPVLSSALAAEQAVQKAQIAYNAAIAGGTKQATAYAAEQSAINAAYAKMSPQQIELARQLGAMSKAWADIKKAETPVVAGALQPWLKSITDLMKDIKPIVADIAPVIGDLGTQFDSLVNSAAFRAFRDFVGATGTAVVSAGGSTMIDLIKAFIILLPQFDPLIRDAAGGLSRLGPAVLTWASSKHTADDIQGFLRWFNDNGPAVGRFIESIGRAVKTLAPGLTAGGAAELGLLTDFLNFVARLPPGLAGPITEVAGAALLLAKLPGGTKVISFAVNLVGKGGAALLNWLSGGVINIGGTTAAAEMRAAMVSGGSAAAAEMRAAMATGGATAAGEEGAGLAAAGAGAGTAASGGFLAALAAAPALPLIGGIIAGGLIKAAGDSLAPKGTTRGAAAAGYEASGAPGASIFGGWVGALAGWLGIGSGSSAASSVNKATEQIVADFKRQADAAKTAQGDVDILSGAIMHNGNASGEAHTARANLLADMEKAGVDGAIAQADIVKFSNAVAANGTQTDQARGARQRLISDILNASSNSKQGQTDLGIYTSAVRNHSLTSDQVRGARQRLITDLTNAGLDAQTATGLVDGLGSSIKKLPAGKTITIKMVGTGDYTVRQSALSGAPGTFAPGSGGVNAISKGAATGMYISTGTTATADDQLIRVSKGEFVHQAKAVSQYGVPAMQAVNEGRAVIGYAAGGVVGSGHTGNLTPGFVGGMYNDFQQKFGQAMVNSMFAALKQAESVGSAPEVLAYAMSFLHRAPYVWGGNTPSGWDCSGYVEYVLRHFGLGMAGRPTAASFQGWATPSGPVPGGLAFYGTPAHHIGFVVNDHTLLSALGHAYGTTLSALNMGDNAGYGVPPMGYGHLGAGPGGGLPIGKLQELAFTLLSERGWGGQWNAFNSLENREAGWNLSAVNPTSGAYGLAQFINGAGEYAQYGGSWLTAQGQLTGMLNYIGQRYPAGPNQAWQHEVADNWYGNGGAINEPVIGFGTQSGQRYVFGENGTEWVTPGDKPPSGAMIGSVSIQLPDGQSVASALSDLNFWLRVAQQQGYAGVLPGG